MKSSVDKLDGLVRKLNVEVPAEKVQSAFDRVYKGIQKNANIKGFRKGKAPMATIKSLYADKVHDDVLNDLVSEGYRAALDEHSLDPIGYPKIDFETLDSDKQFNFSAEFEVRPEVTLKKYEGLKIEKEKIQVSDEQVDSVLENIRSSQAELVPVFEDRAATMGDIAELDFEGIVDGQPLPGGTASGHQLELGSSQFIEGFEEGVAGMAIGETKEINLKFPDDYHSKEIAGKPVKFITTLKSLKKKSLPELNDELAKKVGEFETLIALKDAIRKDLEQNEERRVQEEVRNQVLRRLVEANPVDVPESLKEQQKQMIIEDVKQKMSQQGMGEQDFEEYRTKWKDDFEDSAKFMVQSTFLVDELAEKLKLKATPKDIDEKIKTYGRETGIELEKLNEFYGQPERRSRLGFQITEERVIAHLIEKAEISEK